MSKDRIIKAKNATSLVQVQESAATLAQFIDENSKLVTSIAAFVALTAFSSQLDVSGIRSFLPAVNLSRYVIAHSRASR
jgi:hypothetical protein